MKTDGLIIAYKNLDSATTLAESVFATTQVALTVHDNTEKNENIHRLWNRYLGLTSEKYFLTLNPDTRPEAGWLSELKIIMESTHPRMAAVGPSTDHCYNEQANRTPEIVRLAPGSWVPQVLIPGFCALYRVEALRQIGGWREDFRFYGGDIDLVYRLHLAGWLSAWAVSAFVWHEWGGSAKKLGDQAYQELRYQGNVELQKAVNHYQGRIGIWRAFPGGGVEYAEARTIQGQSQENAGGGGSERSEALEEAAGALWTDRLGKDAS